MDCMHTVFQQSLEIILFLALSGYRCRRIAADVGALKLFDRRIADSRAVALNHMAGFQPRLAGKAERL